MSFNLPSIVVSSTVLCAAGFSCLLSFHPFPVNAREVIEDEWVLRESTTDEGFFAILGLKIDEGSMLVYKVSHLKINDCTSEHSVISVPFVLSENDGDWDYQGYGSQEITVLAGSEAQTFLPFEMHIAGAIERFCFPADQCWGFDVQFRLLEAPEVRLEDGIWYKFKVPTNADALNQALRSCLTMD